MARRRVPRTAFRDVTTALREQRHVDDDAFRRAGLQVAVTFGGFAGWIEREMHQRGIESLFLLSREGPFLEQVLQKSGVDAGAMQVLEVSRVATLLPSMERFDAQSLMRIWERFPRQAPAELLASLGLSVEPFAEVLDRHGLEAGEAVSEPWRDERLRAFLADHDFNEPAMRERDKARELLLTYLDQKGYGQADSVALADVGWRGTIQDSLAALVPEIDTTGLFLAYRPADLAQPANTSKVGFLAGQRVGDGLFGQEIRLAATPLEMLTTCPGGSTVGFERVDGMVVPVRRPIDAEEGILLSEVASFQRGVLEGLEAVAPFSRSGDADFDHALAGFALKSVLFDPPAPMVKIFESYRLDPTIGGQTPIELERPRMGSLLTSSGRSSVRVVAQDHGWPHAVVKEAMGPTAFGLARAVAMRSSGLGRWLA